MNTSRFSPIAPEALENAVKLIGSDWMLITTKDGENDRVNAMTASWGSLGVLWNKPVCVCFVRPQRHTFGLLERTERFSVAFLSENYREALKLCGRTSGRDGDKLAEAGLSTTALDGVPAIAEARLVLVCRKLYADDLKKECFLDETLLSHYPADDFHRMYVSVIETAYLAQ